MGAKSKIIMEENIFFMIFSHITSSLLRALRLKTGRGHIR